LRGLESVTILNKSEQETDANNERGALWENVTLSSTYETVWDAISCPCEYRSCTIP